MINTRLFYFTMLYLLISHHFHSIYMLPILFVIITLYMMYFIQFFHCDMKYPTNNSSFHTRIHSCLYLLIIQVLLSIHHKVYQNPIFNLDACLTPCIVAHFSLFHFHNVRMNNFFFFILFIPIIVTYFYVTYFNNWTIFHKMLQSIVHSLPVIVIIMIRCFLWWSNYSSWSFIIYDQLLFVIQFS